MIEIVKEPDYPKAAFEKAEYEDCFKCNRPTPFWAKHKNVPCCPDCALKLEEADVPTKEQWVAS